MEMKQQNIMPAEKMKHKCAIGPLGSMKLLMTFLCSWDFWQIWNTATVTPP